MPTSTRDHSLVQSAVDGDNTVHFDGVDWRYRPAVIEEEEEEIQEELEEERRYSGGGKQVPVIQQYARYLPWISAPPSCYSPQSLDPQKQPHHTELHSVNISDLSATGHWLLNGRLPAAVPRPKPRHRATRSLTLSLTADPESPVRSLTHAAHPEESAYDAMAGVQQQQQQPPGSPPELASSKSSKSSSFRSSSLSANDTATTDLAHFEDIGLEDEHQPQRQQQQRPHPQQQRSRLPPPGHGPNKQNARLNPRRTSGPAATGRNHSPAFPAMRELINGAARSSPPPLSAPSKPDFPRHSATSLGLPGATHRLGLTSSSTTSLARAAMRNRSRSPTHTRSPSPAHMMHGLLVSPTSMHMPTSLTASPTRTSFSSSTFHSGRPGSRRHSSHAAGRARKTTKELELEYDGLDEDGDNDLPEDASLWNVPLSPALFRTASSALSSGKSSAVTSANTSPERASPRTTPKPSRMRPSLMPGSRSTPLSARPFAPRHSDTMPVPISVGMDASHRLPQPQHVPFGLARAKSWDHVLGEMSEEVKALSEALDRHDADRQTRRQGAADEGVGGGEAAAVAAGKGEAASSSPRPTTPEPGNLTRSRTSPLATLPPLRKNNIMIDPLPVSKEKEAVLSRTRPSWLPPKDRREEKRHLREYQRMMQASAVAEKRRSAKVVEDRCARDDTAARLQRIWDEHVLPDLPAALQQPRTRELWWRGIPPAARAEAWRQGIGNELGLSDATYERALSRAQAAETSSAATHTPRPGTERSHHPAIDADLATAFPALCLFQPGQTLHSTLRSVLAAHAVYRPDLGHVRGAHLPAALLVLVLPRAADAFCALANLLNRPLPLAFLAGDRAGIQRAANTVRRLLDAKRPRLAKRLFDELRLSGEEALGATVRGLFLDGCCDGRAAGGVADTPTLSGFDTNGSGGGGGGSGGLSLPLALRLWDVLVFDGDAAVVRIAAALLGLAEPRLYGGTREEVVRALGGGAGGDDDDGVSIALGIEAGWRPAADDRDGEEVEAGAAAPTSRLGGVDVAAAQWDEDVERVVDAVREAGRMERKKEDEGEGSKDAKQEKEGREGKRSGSKDDKEETRASA